MSIRFRIRTPGGQELSFASVEMFEDFVRAGDLSPDDLVYDAQDGSWAPARTHPIVLDIQYEEERASEDRAERSEGGEAAEAPEGTNRVEGAETADGAESADGPESADGAEPTDGAEDEERAEDGVAESPSFGLELAMVEEISAEEARRQFLEKMEAERADELEFRGDDAMSGFRMETTGSMADLVAPDLAPARPPPPPSPTPTSTPPPRRAHASHAPGRPEPRRETPPARARAAKEAESGGGFGRLVFMVLLLGLVAGAVFLGLRYDAGGAEPPPSEPAVPADPIPVQAEPEPTSPREPVIARTEAAVRERARERFLTSTQTALRNLPSVPESWPGGAYLALPSGHPEVLTVWEEYLTTIRTVRTGDVDRYREAYASALDDAVIEGEERALRLESGLAAFAGTAQARAEHYDRVEALASAAIQSHNALVEAEGLLIYDGTGDGVATGALGAGVSARDEESALLLQRVTGLLTGVLEVGGGGPGSGENVRAWVWDGFLDAVTN